MDKKAYPNILLERFLKTSARASNKTYQLKRCVRVTAIPILSKDEAGAIPASFSFIIEKKDSFASLEIRRKIIAPRLMLLKVKLIEVSPQLIEAKPQLNERGFASRKAPYNNGRCPYLTQGG